VGTGRLDHLRHPDFPTPDFCILVNEAEEGKGLSVGCGDLVAERIGLFFPPRVLHVHSSLTYAFWLKVTTGAIL